MKKIISAFLAVVLTLSLFTVSAYGADRYKNYKGKYGVITTVKSDYKTKIDNYKINKDSGTIYFSFDSKGKTNAYYCVTLYSDSEKTNSVLDITNKFPTKDTTAKITLDFSSFASGTYYGQVYTYIKSGNDKVIDSSSVGEYKITLNKVGSGKPVFTQWEALYTGNYLEWSSVEYASFYRVYRKTTPSGEWERLKQLTDCTFLDTEVEKGKRYYYAVRAFDGSAKSKFDDIGVSLIYLAPVSFKESPKRLPDNGVKLSWESVDGADAYRIYRKKAEDSKYKGLATVSGDVTEYSDFSAKKDGEKYVYKVRAANGADLGPASKAASAEIFGVFKPSVYCEGTTVKVTWDAVEGADRYVLYKLNEENQWISLDLQEDATEYVDEDILPGEKYTYSLVVKKGDEESSFDTNGVSVKCLKAPVIKSTKCGTRDSVVIKWNKVDGAESYKIYRKSPVSDYEYVGETSATEFYDTTKKTNNLKYTYKVQAVSKNCTGIMSGESKSTLYMAAPVLVSVKWDDGNLIKWKRVSGATAYNVYRKTPTGSYKKIAQVRNTLSFVDTTAKKGTAYYYTVCAVNGSVTGAYETGKSINCLDTVKFTAKSNSKGNVTLNWTKVSGATGYYVYRKLSGTTEWKNIGKTTSLTYTDKSTKTSGKIYDYTVKAYNSKGGSKFYDKVGQSIVAP